MSKPISENDINMLVNEEYYNYLARQRAEKAPPKPTPAIIVSLRKVRKFFTGVLPRLVRNTIVVVLYMFLLFVCAGLMPVFLDELGCYIGIVVLAPLFFVPLVKPGLLPGFETRD